MPRPIATHTITQANAAAVLGVLVYETDTKVPDLPRKLIEAALVADDYNLERLERGYEGLISAVRLATEVGDLDTLRRLAHPERPF